MSPELQPAGPRRPQIGRTDQDSEPCWPIAAPLPTGPNIVVILLDDVGFGQLSCFGSSIRTPAIDRIAAQGLRYPNFHTTAVCSPTRAALLTGRNPHSVGFGHVVERLAGFPGYSMRLPDSAATVAEVLRLGGYSTRAFGKWHLTPPNELGPQGPYTHWPLGRGFDRFYGFLCGSTDQYAPDLIRDNSPVSPPGTDANGYHLSEDLVDECIAQTGDLIATAPHQPFFAYLAFGAGHAPHQVPRSWIDRYSGVFDDGWDVERARVLARQVESGILPPDTRLGPRNPGVESWERLDAQQRRLATTMMEVYAGFLSHTDAQIGRLLDHLQHAGVLDDTLVIVLSDNGASAEGGPNGSVDEGLYINNEVQSDTDVLDHVDDLGGPRLYNHYPWGWAQAGNSPYRWYKQFTHAGGITNGLVLSWPNGGVPTGQIRQQYHHVIDIAPTLLDIAGIEPPDQVNGVTQMDLHGVSMRYSFVDADAPSRRRSQHYEMWGNRGMYADGWMAVCRLHPDAAAAIPPQNQETAFDDLPWELYDHTQDPTECTDLADIEPAKLRELIDRWWACAGRYDVLPVDTRPRWLRWPVDPPLPRGAEPGRTVFSGPGGPYERGALTTITGGSFRLEAEVTLTGPGDGMLFALGSRHGGYFWYLSEGELRLEVALSSIHHETVSAPLPTTTGLRRLSVDVSTAADLSAEVTFAADNTTIGTGRLRRVLARSPIGSSRANVGRVVTSSPSGAFQPPLNLAGTLHRLTLLRTSGAGSPTVDDLAVALHEQ